MGDDFTNRQCYVGEGSGAAARLRVQQTILETLTSSGYSEVPSEAEATRSIVIGPAGRWIFVGDTAGSTEDADPTAFTALSVVLSTTLPVVDVHMSDSAAVHIYLYKGSSLVDKFGNAAFPFFSFKTDEEAAEFKGVPELWAEYLLPPHTANDLRRVWAQGGDANSILSDTAKLFGWDPDLSFVGYTLDDEGCGIKYDEYLQLGNRQGFTEMHFRK